MLKCICEYITKDKYGNTIIYNETNAKFDKKGPNKDEVRAIDILRNKMGWDIDFIRRINEPDNISTPDLKRYINKSYEYWEIKTLKKSKSEKSKKYKIKHKLSKQCKDFVFDLNDIECDLTNYETIQQIKEVYRDNRFDFVNRIVLLGKSNLIKVYKRK